MTTLNPLDWTAGPFLNLYCALALIATLIVVTLRGRIGPLPDRVVPPLDELEVGYLAGGPTRAVDTIIVALIAAGAATPAVTGSLIDFDGSVPVAMPWQRYRPDQSGIMTRQSFHTRTIARLDSVRDRLMATGLCPDDASLGRFRLAGAVVLMVPGLLGAAKAIIGSQRNRPVGILVMLLIVTALVGIGLLWRQPIRTRAGTAALEKQRDRNARAARAPLPDEMPLAFALAGAPVLLGTPFDGFARQLRRPADGNSGCGGGGSGGGSCGGGGGGGGCGGCGSD